MSRRFKRQLPWLLIALSWFAFTVAAFDRIAILKHYAVGHVWPVITRVSLAEIRAVGVGDAKAQAWMLAGSVFYIAFSKHRCEGIRPDVFWMQGPDRVVFKYAQRREGVAEGRKLGAHWSGPWYVDVPVAELSYTHSFVRYPGCGWFGADVYSPVYNPHLWSIADIVWAEREVD